MKKTKQQNRVKINRTRSSPEKGKSMKRWSEHFWHANQQDYRTDDEEDP